MECGLSHRIGFRLPILLMHVSTVRLVSFLPLTSDLLGSMRSAFACVDYLPHIRVKRLRAGLDTGYC